MALITASNHPAALWPGVAKWFGQSYDEDREQWRDLFEMTSSEKRYEERNLSNGFNLAPIKSEGSAITYEADTQGYTSRIANKTYGLGFQVTEEELEDNLYRDVAFDRAGKLAFSMRITKEITCANVYNRAFNASYPGGDGVSLLNSAHPTISGNQSNILSPAADLSEQSLEDLTIQIMKATDFNGKKISLKPESLIIPVDLVYEADRILNSGKQSGTANNDLNALREMGVFPGGIKPNQFLDDTDAFFIRNKVPSNTGMIYQERRKMRLQQDNDFDTGNAKAKATMRFGVGWADGLHALFGSQGA